MNENLDYILFLYGLSCLLLATISFRLWKEKIKTTLHWQWMALFGLFNGIYEWFELASLAFSFPFFFKIAILLLMGASFCFLFEFGRRSFPGKENVPLLRPWIYAPLFLLCLGCGFYGLAGWAVGFRYAFALPGSVLTALAFFHRSSHTPFHHKEWLRGGGILFFLFAIAAGCIGPKADFFPAFIINQDAFLKLMGIPIQAVQGCCAVFLSLFSAFIFLNLKISWSSENTRSHIKRIFFYQTIALIVVVALGWFFVNKISSEKFLNKQKVFLDQTRILSKTINPQHLLKFQKTKDDIMLPQCDRLWDQLKQMMRVFPQYRFSYLLGERDQKFIFLIDSEPAGSPDRSLPGDVYDDAPSELFLVFEGKKEKLIGPYVDQWGTWVTAAAPILHSDSGQVLAIFCIDRSASDWNKDFSRDRLAAISFILGLCMFILLGFFIFGRNRSLDRKLVYLETFYTAGLCLLITAFLFIFAVDESRSELSSRFQRIADLSEEIFYDQFAKVRRDLDLLEAFFHSSTSVTSQEFSRFASFFVQDHDGRQAFAWIPLVRQEEVAEYEEKARRDGAEDFFIFEKTKEGMKVPAAQRPEYFPLFYLRPVSDRKQALGFDENSEPTRRQTLERARATGLRQVTPMIDFVVDQKKRRQGLIVYQPLYARQEVQEGGKMDPGAFQGFLMAAIRPQTMLESGLRGWFEPESSLAQIFVLDISDPSKVKVLASFPKKEIGMDGIDKILGKNPGRLQETRFLYFFGRSYVMVIIPEKIFFKENQKYLPLFTLWGGLLLTFVVTFLVHVLQSQRYKAENIVALRTAELFDSEQRFRSLFNNMANGVAIYKAVDDGNDFVFVDLNRSGQELSKVSIDEVRGKRVTEVFPGVSDIGLLKAMTRVWRTGTSEACPQSFYKDGRIEQWVENFVCKISSGLIAAIYTDTTLLKRSQADLAQAHDQLRSIMDAATQVSIISTDLNGIIVTFNKGAQNILGYREEEVVGKQVYSLLHLGSEMEAYDQELSKEFGYPVSGFETFVVRVKHGQREEREWTYIKKDGTSLKVNLVVTAIRREAGKITGFLGIATDITERKKADDHLKRTLAELQQFHAATLNRESRVIELKKEINALSVKLGQNPPYDLSFLGQDL